MLEFHKASRRGLQGEDQPVCPAVLFPIEAFHRSDRPPHRIRHGLDDLKLRHSGLEATHNEELSLRIIRIELGEGIT